MAVSPQESVAGSFRDPCGFVFTHGKVLYRQVNQRYREDYDQLIRSGLYDSLVSEGLLIPHEEEPDLASAQNGLAYKVLRPQVVPFISYPYEWCFSQLKAAALATLEIQKKAFAFGMTLKDASAYNIQFVDGRPTLIDTLSFEQYREGRPWTAYRQYCQHFLAPLALMARVDVRLGELLRNFIDGIPLDLAASLLPARTRLNPSLLMHLYLHARSQKKHAGQGLPVNGKQISRLGFQGLIDNLASGTERLRWEPRGQGWADYYSDNNYSGEAFDDKQRLVRVFLETLRPAQVWDLGANTGIFSRLAAQQGFLTIAIDSDPAAVEHNYRSCRNDRLGNVLPLLGDLTNPSPNLGWAAEERMSLEARGPVDLAMALALIHHLVIGNNTPFEKVAQFLSRIARHLIIEFVPKQDSQVQRMLASREDIFDEYDPLHFEEAFARYFSIERREPVNASERTMYLMKAKN